MNATNAKDYLPLVQALAEGKTIQKFSDGDGWEDVRSPSFESPAKLYRIKPEQKKQWYRVVMMQNNYNSLGVIYTTTVDNDEADEKTMPDHPDFVEWLTGRIEYELPEGE